MCCNEGLTLTLQKYYAAAIYSDTLCVQQFTRVQTLVENMLIPLTGDRGEALRSRV